MASLAVTNDRHILLHEGKGQPKEIEETHIVEAFGARKCPKLVDQVRSAKRAVRVNALAVLCDEMHNPMSVVGCVEAGVVATLNKQTRLDPDPLTRERASRALAIMANDSNGRIALLENKTPTAVVVALDDQEVKVRRNVYESLIRLSSGAMAAVRALVEAKYATILVAKAANEHVNLQPLALKLLCHCLSDETGLEDALMQNAVETCITLLSSFDTSVRREAANTLSVLCFADIAKGTAIKNGAVPQLIELMKDREVTVRTASVAALMAITMTDDGKKKMIPEDLPKDYDPRSAEPEDGPEGPMLLMELLKEDVLSLKLNVLKCMSNVAVHPIARDIFKCSRDNLMLISELVGSTNQLLAKHATITKNAVLWMP